MTTRRRASFPNSGVTCIEILLIALYIGAIVIGIQRGWTLWTSDGTAWWLAGIAFSVAISLAAVVAALFAILTPVWLYLAISAILSPADLVCRCGESQNPPKELLPEDSTGAQAMEAASEPALAPAALDLDEEFLKRISTYSGHQERIAAAASLGLAPTGATPGQFAGPVIQYKSWDGPPKDIRDVLRSGLPPRLILAWSAAVMERALPVFEKEFHQDTRPRQILGAAVMILHGRNPGAAALCGKLARATWAPEYFGCRVVHRGVWERIFVTRTRGHNAALAAYSLAQLAACYGWPERLWKIYEPGDIRGGYDTQDNRIAYSQAALYAEAVSGHATEAAEDKLSEEKWQRETLARMILEWKTWEEDRKEWENRLDGEWIKLIQENMDKLNFNAREYIGKVRERLTPWRKEAGPAEP